MGIPWWSKLSCLRGFHPGVSVQLLTINRDELITVLQALSNTQKHFPVANNDLYGQHDVKLVQTCTYIYRGARWLSGRASDSGARVRGFETYLRRVVNSPKVLVIIPRKRWLRPDMTENFKPQHSTLNLCFRAKIRNKCTYPCEPILLFKITVTLCKI